MQGLKLYSQSEINELIVARKGETKIGERVQVASSLTDISKTSAKFVLFGIPEDIGVRANSGLSGAASAWKPSLTAFLNIQSNRFLIGNEVLVLGHVQIDEPTDCSLNGLRNKVHEIDELVFPVVQQIVASGKIPIAIGGGHNNSFPMIKGTALAKQNAIDVLNIDAHADLRELEGRHSGNGFSYALNEGYLQNYFIYGLHQSYNNEAILNEIETNPQINAVFFDDILQRAEALNFQEQLTMRVGLEIDLDCIQNVLSSAETPSGFAVNDIRKLILKAKNEFLYLHICEGAIKMGDNRESKSTAKLIAYLVSDFIKSRS